MPEITPQLSKTHAVPQHIAAFEFKLIGDLTIKQFLFAGVGVAVAYAAWISELNFFLKWAVIISSLGLGLGTAFFPIQDRTLDQWLLNFIAALFSPTQRVWRKEPQPPEYLREDYSQFLTSQVLSITPLQSRRRLQQYLGGLKEVEISTGLEDEEFVEKLNFDVPLPTTVEVEIEKREERVERRKEQLPERKELPVEPKLASEVNLALEKTLKIPREGEVKQITVLQNITPGRKVRLPTIEGTIRLRPEEIKLLPERKISPPKPKEPLKELIKEVAKPPQPPIPSVPSKPSIPSPLPPPPVTPVQKEAPLVTAPTPVIDKKIPNLISGVVKDREGKLLENVVVIIKDQDGDPVRALKTNKLGQFAISTPLENGNYTVEVSSKERYFDIMKTPADGSVLPPLEFKEKYG